MNTYFLTVLLCVYSINAVAAFEKTCDVVTNTVHALCEGVQSLFKQNNLRLGHYLCNCVTAFLTSKNYDSCKAHTHEFLPKCDKLFISEEFESLTTHKNALSDFIVNTLFKHIFKVCDDKNRDDVINFVKSLFQSKTIYILIEGVINIGLPPIEATLINDCYNELRGLV